MFLYFFSDYYDDEAIKRNILQLYSKAKSNEHLVRLMSSWSSFEAADGEYEIAVKWLLEAQKHGMNCITWDGTSEQEWVYKNIISMKEFLAAQNIAATNRLKAKEMCNQLVKDHNNGDLLQLGDCYALHVQLEIDHIKAYELIEEMLSRGLSPAKYMEEETINIIYEATGRDPLRGNDDSQDSNESKEDEKTA